MATLTRSNDMAILREDTLLLGAICLLRHDRIPTDLLYPPKELALPNIANFCYDAASYLSEDGDFIRDFDGAIELINIGLRAAAYGKHDIFVAHLLNTRGVVKELTYQYQKAEQALEKSVTIWMRILGHLHLQSNVTLMNLASVRAAQGDYVQALQLYKHVDLAIAWFTDHEKQFALFRLAVNVGRCFAAICCGRYAGVCKDLLRIRDGIPHGWRESEPYRRKIEYWIGNLSLADGNKLEKAETSYRLCLTTRYPHEGTKENALLTVACYYKLAAVEFELSRGDPYRYPAALQHVNMAINLAKKYKSQGYLGRALLLKEEIARSTPSTYFEEPPENIRSKVDAVEADLKQRLQKLPNERVVLGTPLEIFCHFIPWQVR
ncbi:hypothetical protein B0T17DRAFT_658600 [Bombardia bombarda]|uniref:Uncharacterized protein n=1 Tax=Bombardia bombarda TaxID=252184 RepID=A0AA39WBK2_9PEZI|nr:hypothetical protein B0T17DRAFT_658600 [Bombardia bombarda]